MGKKITPQPTLVQADSFLTLHYRLAGPNGDVITTFGGKPATIEMGAGQLSPVLEQCLLGLAEGDRRTFQLKSAAVFGERKAEMQQWLPYSLLQEIGDPEEKYVVGEVVRFPTPDGEAHYAGAVIAVRADAVLFDFNHPLAGLAVTFEVEIIGVL